MRDGRAQQLKDEHRELHRLAEEVRAKGLTVTALLLQGPTIETLVDEVRRLDVDLVVAGCHGRGALSSVVLGSVSTGLLRHAPCPVLIVPTRSGQ